jgi:hypothetical protein
MFGKLKRRDNRKQRLSSWFATERDGDMQAFDLVDIASGVIACFRAARREHAQRRSTAAALKT